MNFNPAKAHKALKEAFSGVILPAEYIFIGQRPKVNPDGDFILISTPGNVVDWNGYGHLTVSCDIFSTLVVDSKNITAENNLYEAISSMMPLKGEDYTFDLSVMPAVDLGFEETENYSVLRVSLTCFIH